MDLKWPWLAIGLAVLVVAALIGFSWYRSRRQRTAPSAYLLAHSARIRALPRFRSLIRREIALAQWLTVAVLVTAAGAVLLAARPQTTEVSQETRANRDIVLCLDASSSMFDEDVQVLETYADIAENLHGERISLVIWSEAAVTVFPLTDDEAFIQDQLEKAQDAMAIQDPEFVEGTYLGKRASAISDGLVSCVDGFDKADKDRGRAIVLASDNDPQGAPPIFTLQEASEYAQEHDVRVYGIGSPDLEYDTQAREEFEKAVTGTGGTFSILGDDGSSDEIAAGVQDLEAERISEPPEIAVQEQPTVAIAFTGIGVLMLIVGWGVALVVRVSGGRR